MSDLMREAPFGQLVRLLTRNKFFQYPEEKPDFHCPTCYTAEGASAPKDFPNQDSDSNEVKNEKIEEKDDEEGAAASHVPTRSESIVTQDPETDLERQPTLGLQRTQTLPFSPARLEVEQELAAEKTKSRPIVPTKTANGLTLVDWYKTDDPANPQNWSQKKKAFVALQIDLYTFVVYCGSSIYVSSEL